MFLWKLTATEIIDGIKARKFSAYEVTKAHLDRLESVNPMINAVVHEMPEKALQKAREIDRKVYKNEDIGLLAGVPVTVKVNIDQKNFATTNGVTINQKAIAKEDSPVVRNLKKADAIIIGRTNTPSFSLRWFTNNLLHGHTKNPVNQKLTPGGSSGGASASVAAGICPIAHGTDIAGSIRYPAYACGVHGIRPSFGRVPTYNATTGDRFLGGQLMAVSGPLARSIDDLKIALQAFSEEDLRDPWYTKAQKFEKPFYRKAAISPFPDSMNTDKKIVSEIHKAKEILEENGWLVEEVECPSFCELANINLRLWMAESSTIKDFLYKEKDEDAIFVYEHMVKKCGNIGLDEIMTCIKNRASQIRKWSAFLNTYSLLICPTSARLPFLDQEDVKGSNEFEDILEAQLTQLGLPVIGFPGLALATGVDNMMPCGIQLISNKFREDIILEAGRIVEGALYRPSVLAP